MVKRMEIKDPQFNPEFGEEYRKFCTELDRLESFLTEYDSIKEVVILKGNILENSNQIYAVHSTDIAFCLEVRHRFEGWGGWSGRMAYKIDDGAQKLLEEIKNGAIPEIIHHFPENLVVDNYWSNIVNLAFPTYRDISSIANLIDLVHSERETVRKLADLADKYKRYVK